MTDNKKINLTASFTKWPRKIIIKRVLWTFGLEPIGRWLPKFCSPIRIFLLILMGAKIDYSCLILPGVKVLMPWNLKTSSYVAIGSNVNIYNFAEVSIGSMTVISQNVFICTGSHDYTKTDMPLIMKAINIGSECWIAADSFICPGVTIGHGAVIGARSNVTKNLPEWMVCTGNPCIPKKSRVIE